MIMFRVLVVGLLAAVCLTGFQAAPAEASASEAAAVEDFTKKQLGKAYKWGATGLRRYDCSGLVYRAFAETGLLERIGSNRRTAHGYFRWFRDRGLLTKNPKLGDLVAWGKDKATHIGIFAGYDSSGRALAYSALYNGVSRHRVNAIGVSLKAYLAVNLSR